MDLGRVFCRARKVDCEICPMKENCRAFANGEPLRFPETPTKKIKKYYDLKLVRFIISDKDLKENEYYFFKRVKGKWLEGQYELPTFILESEDERLDQYPRIKKSLFNKFKIEKEFKSSITKYKIKNIVISCKKSSFLKSFPKQKLYKVILHRDQNISSASRKVFKIY